MKNLIFLPIDIDLSELNFQQSIDSDKSPGWINPNRPHWVASWWDSSIITEETIKKTKFDQIIKQLPLTRIIRLTHKIQKKKVDPHVDCQPRGMVYDDGEYEHLKSTEPSGYRIVLSGSPDALWIHDNKEWHNVKLPSVPCCYVLNATAGYHKLDLDLGRETIYLRGYVDLEKHQDLIKRSLEKYKDYAVYFQ